MPRNLDSSFAASLSNPVFRPLILAQLTFRSATRYVHTALGNFVWDSKTFVGIGSLGKVGSITEGVNVRAEGTSVGLSGIDPTLSAECLTDIRLGAPANIWLASLDENMGLIGTPYLWFSGTVDKPVQTLSADEMQIVLALENKMINLQRPSVQRYTSADQRLRYPTDISMSWVEQLSDLALVEGQ